jgi:puromycin-sensitive aminopeptidase
MAEQERVLLPDDVIPKRYDLTLKPDLERFTFSGSESVDVEVKAATRRIVVHATELEIHSAALERDGATREPESIEANEEEETVAFVFGETMEPGPARLAIEFTGQLNDKMHGFYRGVYHQDGEKRTMAVTQFEATDARRAFPCWDEPAQKAVFAVTLVVPEDRVAVSNMPPSEVESGDDGFKTVRFADTPVMSTYLLAFVVGDFDYVETETKEGVTVRVYTPVGRREQGRFALDVSVDLLGYFNEYFGIPYPLEKMDHIAIPDFAAGAMENWGAITYREIAILVDPENTSAGTKQIVASIVSHEMAHQWFGNLVTMAWWDALWLNESFASWMGDKAVDHLFPEWDTWTSFVSQDTTRALSLDGLKNSHPIHQEVKNPAEIGQLFDAISYSKGGSVLRMLEDFLGSESFREGLHDYLVKYSYDNADTGDLWDALGAASGEPVSEMMETWLYQTGYPYLDAEIEHGDTEITVSVEQRRFVYDSIIDDAGDDETLWHVPLRARSGQSGNVAYTLQRGRSASLGVGGGTNDWVKINPEQTGFFRVKYRGDDLALLRPAIESLDLSAVDRLGIQSDAYALAKAGIQPASEFLEIAQAYVNENHAYVWGDLGSNLGALDNLLSDEPFFDAYQRFGRELFGPAGARVGWDPKPGEGHLDALLRSTVLAGLGGYGDSDTLAEAGRRFGEYVNDPSSVNPDIRRVVLSLTAKEGDSDVYHAMWKLEQDATLEEEKVRLLGALTEFEDQDLLMTTLERSLDTEFVRTHNTIGIMARTAGNPKGKDLAWDFLKSNWSEFDRRYGEGGFGLMTLVSTAGRFTTQEKLEDVEKFFTDNPVPAADRTIRQALEAIRLNVAWLEKNRGPLAEWLSG